MRLALFVLLALPLSAAAQPSAERSADHDAVMAPIHALFDGMRAADSAAVRSAFHPTATLRSVGEGRDGVVAVHETPLAGFVAAMGGDHPLYDERLGEAEVRVDGDLATVWVPYAFYLGDAFSHCGTNAFQLARTGGAWTIIHIADTRRKSDCDPSIGG